MAFESFQLNLKLTEYGFQKVMALDGKPVGIKYIALGKGNATNTAGFNVDFRDTKDVLPHIGIMKQIDSSQKESYVENGEQLARIDTATIFDGDENFDVRSLGFYDEDENGEPNKMVYVWSDSDPEIIYAPKRPKIHLVISISQHLLFAEEATAVTVIDAGIPFELFLQPLKDDFDSQFITFGATSVAAFASLTAKYMQSSIEFQNHKTETANKLSEAEENTANALEELAETVNENHDEQFAAYGATVLSGYAGLTAQFMQNSLDISALETDLSEIQGELDEQETLRLSAIQGLREEQNIVIDNLREEQETININLLAAISGSTAMAMNNTIGGS